MDGACWFERHRERNPVCHQVCHWLEATVRFRQRAKGCILSQTNKSLFIGPSEKQLSIEADAIKHAYVTKRSRNMIEGRSPDATLGLVRGDLYKLSLRFSGNGFTICVDKWVSTIALTIRIWTFHEFIHETWPLLLSKCVSRLGV